MSSEIWFFVYAFAIYRLAELIAHDLIFDTLRRWIAKRAAVGGRVWKMVAYWIHCSLCIGVWLSFPAAVLYSYTILYVIKLKYLIPLWLGMAGVQYFLSSVFLENGED